MPRKKQPAPVPVLPPAPAPEKPQPAPKMTAAERAELAELRERYDVLKPPAHVMIPVPHHRLLRLVALERRDAVEAGR